MGFENRLKWYHNIWWLPLVAIITAPSWAKKYRWLILALLITHGIAFCLGKY